MKKLRKAYIALIMAFLYAPIVLLILYSFNDSKSRANWGGFTLRWYKELFSDAAIMSALSTTLSVGLLAAVFSTLLGTVGAIALYQMKRLPRKTLLSIVNLPMLNSEVVTGVSLMLLYAMANIQLGYLTLLLSHIAFCVPYVVLSVMPKLRQIDPNLAEAAQDLGATPMQGFFKVILPDIMPGVFSGFVMALTMSIDDFVVSFFTTGSGVSNLSITIYTMAKRGISPKINAVHDHLCLCVCSAHRAESARLPQGRLQPEEARRSEDTVLRDDRGRCPLSPLPGTRGSWISRISLCAYGSI